MTSARQTSLLDSIFSPGPEGGADDERKRRDGRFALQICVDTRRCHDWLRLNDALPAEGSPSWCLLLSPQEQQAWTDSLIDADRAKGAD